MYANQIDSFKRVRQEKSLKVAYDIYVNFRT